MEHKVEEILPKYLQLLIKEVEDKNITGVRFVKQEDRVMLLFDKALLSKTFIKVLNNNADEPSLQLVKLKLERIHQNVQDYLRRNVQGGESSLRIQNNGVGLIEEK